MNFFAKIMIKEMSSFPVELSEKLVVPLCGIKRKVTVGHRLHSIRDPSSTPKEGFQENLRVLDL